MITILLAASSLLAATVPAAAPAEAAAPPSAVSAVTVKGAQDPDALVCHREVTPNSRVPRKVCVRSGDVHPQSDQDVQASINAAQSRAKASMQSTAH